MTPPPLFLVAGSEFTQPLVHFFVEVWLGCNRNKLNCIRKSTEFHPREFSFPTTVSSVFSLGSPALDGMLLSSLLETEIRTTLALTCLSLRGCDDELVVLDPVVAREGAGTGGGKAGGAYCVPIDAFAKGGT